MLYYNMEIATPLDVVGDNNGGAGLDAVSVFACLFIIIIITIIIMNKNALKACASRYLLFFFTIIVACVSYFNKTV